MSERAHEPYLSVGLLILRVGSGSLLLSLHGWTKLTNFGARAATFSDPIGIGSEATLALAVFAEFFCAAAVVLGVATRLVSIPVAVTMLVAAFVQHAADPWSRKELALIYLIPFVTLAFTGPGIFSLDRLLGPFYRRFLGK